MQRCEIAFLSLRLLYSICRTLREVHPDLCICDTCYMNMITVAGFVSHYGYDYQMILCTDLLTPQLRQWKTKCPCGISDADVTVNNYDLDRLIPYRKGLAFSFPLKIKSASKKIFKSFKFHFKTFESLFYFPP